MSVRVRFAPSPTGMLHVGALRDALHKFLLARHEGGQNILRIEDTDRTRYDPASEREFVETLHWAGIDFDEGPHVGGPHAPYRQSERKEAGIYAHWIEVLLAAGHAYKAFETPEELAEMRRLQEIEKRSTGYFGGSWRDASPDQVAKAEAEGKPFVIRQRIPRDTEIEIVDLIRGKVKWNSNEVDDPVLIKADGMPTYHFAAIVDDHLMEITHTMRGEEWLSSAPKHACLFDQFGWQRPAFVHCPVIVGNDGKKLSKRHGATRVLDYKAQGFLPHALKNFVALIGWSPGDEREAMTEPELIGAFSLKGMQPSPGRFDLDKLKWLDGHNIREMSVEGLLDAALVYASDDYVRRYWSEPVEDLQAGANPIDGALVLSALDLLRQADRDYALQAVALEQERVSTLADLAVATAFFFDPEPPMDAKAVEKWFRQEHVLSLFEGFVAHLEPLRATFAASGTAGVAVSPTAETLWKAQAAEFEPMLRQYAADHGFEKLGPIVHPLRVALTGRTFGPGLFELMEVLGPERMIARLERAKRML